MFVVMRDDVYAKFIELDAFPKKETLHKYLRNEKQIKFPEDTYTKLSKQKPVPIDYANGFVTYLNKTKERLAAGVQKFDLTTECLFREAEYDELPTKFVAPTRADDRALRGIDSIIHFVLRFISSRRWQRFHKINRDKIYDVRNDPETYKRFTQFSAGLDETLPNRTPGSIAGVVEMGREVHFGRHVDKYVEFLRMACNINPGFARFAMLSENEVAGITIVFCITDEAFLASVRGEHTDLSYREEDIVPSSNNLVLFSYAEAPVAMESAKEIKKRRAALQAGLMYHIASLLSLPFGRTYIRAISHDVLASNAKRLRRVGFRPIRACYATGPGCNRVLVLDRRTMGYLSRCRLRFLFSLLDYIRCEIIDKSE
ncbi:MAG: hypothetical protein JNL67_16445 [Planctomycetaceae bacterium]|nr:hypothetical protein [Planctomycetaceae bacterium]